MQQSLISRIFTNSSSANQCARKNGASSINNRNLPKIDFIVISENKIRVISVIRG